MFKSNPSTTGSLMLAVVLGTFSLAAAPEACLGQNPKQVRRMADPNWECVAGRWCYRTRGKSKFAQDYPWHGGYYHNEWGAPVALVVPPTAEKQTNYGWGVGNTRVSRIGHQFRRDFPGYSVGGSGPTFRATPPWPSDTSQFGVYYVRGPW